MKNHSAKRWILSGWIVLIFFNASFALNFDSFTMEDGLPGNLVYCINQDRFGWIWIGTDQGLSRFDGYRFTNFLPSSKDSSSIKGLHVRAIYEDKRGNLWVGTDLGGLNLFDRNKEIFVQPFEKELQYGSNSTSIFDIKEDSNGNLWVASDKRIFRIDSTGKVMDIQELGLGDIYEQVDPSILKIEFDRSGKMWIGTRSSLCAINMTSKTIFRFDSINDILFLYLDSKNKLWVATNLSGLFFIDPISMKVETKILEPKNERSSSVRQVIENSSGNYWISTRGGLYFYEPEKDSYKHFRHDERETSSLLSNSVISLFIDNNEELWVGTRQGLNLLLNNKQAFENFTAHPADKTNRYLNSNGIYALWVDKEHNIWVGTEDGGINIRNKHTGLFSYKTKEKGNPNSISENCIKAFLDDKKGNLWIGTFLGGIDVLNLQSGKIQNYRNDPKNPKSLISNEVWDFTIDEEKNIWIATSLGVNKYDTKTGYFIDFPNLVHNERVNWISTDSKNNIWFGTNKEVVIYSPNNNIIVRHKENSLSFLEDSKGRYWITTYDAGLALYSIEEGALKFYGKQEGMPSNHTFCVIEDDDQNIWVSTSNGISRFDTKNQSIINYNKKDGIQNNVFKYGAAFKTLGGDIMFGNNTGFIKFNPNDIVTNTSTAPIILTELRIQNRKVNISNNENSILKKSLSLTDKLELAYNQNAFSMEFAALNFASGSNEYSYKLEGFDLDWSEPSNNRVATYNNLEPGDYLLRVSRVVNNSRLLSNELRVNIKILPPFWKALWFRILIFILIFIFLNFIIFFFINRERTKMELVLERMKVKKENELNNLKLKFFTNISHEIRTPLTLILTPLEKMRSMQVKPEDNQTYLEIIYRNAKNLYDLINQLLDFRKLDTGNLKLEPAPGNIVATIEKVVDSFQSFAIEKKIQLRFYSDLHSVTILFDADVVKKILNNLLSNAIKFTKPEGKITVGITMVLSEMEGALTDQFEKRRLNISVEDSGIGIAEENLDKIFDRFFQSGTNMEYTGTGIGLSFVKELVNLHDGQISVESKTGYGSKFIVTLPYHPVEVEPANEKIERTPDDFNLQSANNRILLVVEDNPDVRRLIKDHFQDSFQVYEADNGKEGWEQTLKVVPDLIISDVLMPDINGFEFCQKIKTDERTSHIPILLLTALHSKENIIKGLESGADDYVTKPFDLIILQTKIDNILSIRESYKKKFSTTMMIKPKDIVVTSPDQKFLQKAIDTVEKYISDPELDLEQFVVEVGVSRMQLYRKLHALTDMTVKEFIRDIRLKRAAQLLEQDTMTVSEVAYAVGFKDVSHFGKCFRQAHGINATEYKRSNTQRTHVSK